MFEEVRYIIPERMQEQILCRMPEHTEELRFRTNKPVCAVFSGKEQVVLQENITSFDLEHMVLSAAKNSVYSVNHCLKDGYLILPGGHRLGVCGQAVTENGDIKTLREFSSVSLRFSKQRKGIAPTLSESTLIAGPPGSGKTTMLQDCIRNISDIRKQRVCVVDERGEIACCANGIAQRELGLHTDVLTGCEKRTGMITVLRAMNPQWIAVDEITKKEDVDALIDASYCGVSFLATVHAFYLNDLKMRPIYKNLLSQGIFRKILFISADHTARIVDVDSL